LTERQGNDKQNKTTDTKFSFSVTRKYIVWHWISSLVPLIYLESLKNSGKFDVLFRSPRVCFSFFILFFSLFLFFDVDVSSFFEWFSSESVYFAFPSDFFASLLLSVSMFIFGWHDVTKGSDG
jgi:hypothetical protein